MEFLSEYFSRRLDQPELEPPVELAALVVFDVEVDQSREGSAFYPA